jgi:hypothetical protein
MPLAYTFAFLFGGTSTALDTAGSIINDAAVEMGLSAVEDPYTNTSDPNFTQLAALLKSLGRDLWRRHTWPNLTKVALVTTEEDDGAYPLPADFGYFIQDTAWNRSTSYPMYPMTPADWQAVKGRSTQLTLTNFFRIQQHQLMLLPDTTLPAGQTIAYEYVSRFWVQPATESEPTTTAPTANDDVLWFDPLLCVRGLKAYFLAAKGLPTAAAAKEEFDETLYLCMGDHETAPVVSSGPRHVHYLIDENNLPDTGHGT